MALLSLVADLIGVGTGIWLVYLGVRAALKKRSDPYLPLLIGGALLIILSGADLLARFL